MDSVYWFSLYTCIFELCIQNSDLPATAAENFDFLKAKLSQLC